MINEVLTFIEQKLDELKDEKEELMQYQKLDNERRCLEFTIYDKELQQASTELQKIEDSYLRDVEQSKDLFARREAVQNERASLEDEIKLLQTEHDKSEAAQQTLRKDLQAALKAKAKAELEVKEFEDRASTEKKNRSKAHTELAELETLINTTTQQLAAVSKTYARRKAEEDEAISRATDVERQTKQLLARKGRSKQFSSKRERDRSLQQEIQDLNKAIHQGENQLQTLETDEADMKKQLTKLNAKANKFSEQLENTRLHLTESVQQFEECGRKMDEANNVRKEAWRHIQELQDKQTQIRAARQQAEAHLQFTMDKSTFRGLESVKRFVKEQKIEGYHGPLIELFSCADSFIKCVEITAATSLFHIVVDNDEVATRLVKLLTQHKAGRATFIPLDNISPEQPRYPNVPDVLPMIEQLKFDARYEKAMIQVFGRTLIARNMEIGANIARTHNLDTITLDGDQVNKKGAMTGGYNEHKKSRLEAVKEAKKQRELCETVDEKLETLQKEASEADQQVSLMLGEKQKLDTNKLKHKSEMSRLQFELDQNAKQIKNVEQSIQELVDKMAHCKAEIRRNQENVSNLQEELQSDFVDFLSEEDQKELTKLTEEAAALQTAIIQAQGARSDIEVEKSRLETELSENLLKKKQELSAITSVGGSEESVEQLDRATRELKDAESAVKDAEQPLAKLEASIDAAVIRLRKLQTSLDALKNEELELDSKVQSEHKSKDRLMNKSRTLKEKREECQKKIRDLGSLPSGIERHSSKSLDQLIRGLEQTNHSLSKFSHVNKKALEQFTSFTDQREELLGRKEEADNGQASIMQLIEHLDQKKDEAIQRTFKEVAFHFSKVFTELVPDGKAALVINTNKEVKASSNDDDGGDRDLDRDLDLDRDDDESDEKKRDVEANQQGGSETKHFTGIGIRVSFTGSSSDTNLSKLSGGQQTVVALSLIFAIQRTDPSPFYLFDEIDSNLDAVHRTAVAQMINRQSGDTQFLCTTFRPEMLATAKKFFGVNFENKLSRLKIISKEQAEQLMHQVEEEQAA